MITLGQTLTALNANAAAESGPQFASVVIDSRQAVADSLFVAFKGENVDGHDYVRAAFANGAIAAIVEQPVDGTAVVDCRTDVATQWNGETPVQFWVDDSQSALQQVARYWLQLHSVVVTAITGSVGKTTTKELAHDVLSQRFNTLKSEKNFNTEIGLPLQILNLTDAHEHAVLEMGMYVEGDIALLCSVAPPQVGVITNVGSVHMSRAGSKEAIMRGKRELVEALPADGTAILNRDDDYVMRMVPHTKAKIFTYGLSDSADLFATDIESMGLQGIHFAFNYAGEKISVQLPLLGRHSVQTALRAAAVGLVNGLEWDEIVRGLSNHQAQLRLLVVDGPNDSLILDDTYNASPQSTIAALNLLNDLDGRKMAVLGNMLELGDDEQAGHERVGLRALEVADVLVVIGNLGKIIGETAVSAGMNPSRVHFADTPEAAISLVESLIEPRDTILIKGSLGARLAQVAAALTVSEERA